MSKLIHFVSDQIPALKWKISEEEEAHEEASDSSVDPTEYVARWIWLWVKDKSCSKLVSSLA